MKIRKTAVKFIIVLLAILLCGAILRAKTNAEFFVPVSATAFAPAGDASAVYARSCARCHGSDGKAQTAKGKQTGAVDFTSAKWKPDESKGIRVIKNGKGKMPPFKDTLSPDEIRAVWNYVRSFKQ